MIQPKYEVIIDEEAKFIARFTYYEDNTCFDDWEYYATDTISFDSEIQTELNLICKL